MAEPAVVPVVFYKDPLAALKWLEKAFGFETTTLLVDPQGRVGHAVAEFLGCAIGVGGEWTGPQLGGGEMKSPASLGGAGTQFIRIALPSGIDEHCARARAAGARITQEPEDQFYGDRTYRAADLEGHIWNFGMAVREVTLEEMQKAVPLRQAKLEEI